jgi:hypothetical protein
LIDVEDVAGDLAQLEGESPAVHGLGAEELEREHFERAANDLGALVWSQTCRHLLLVSKRTSF